MERFFKSQLSSLVESGDYDPSDQTDRYNLYLVISEHFCLVDTILHVLHNLLAIK